MNAFFNLALAPLVVAQRLPLLWLEGLRAATPGPGRPEAERMITEKLLALQLGLVGAQVEAFKAALAVGTAIGQAGMKGSAAPAAAVGGAMATGSRRIAEAALAPAGKRVRGNLRRLSRRGSA